MIKKVSEINKLNFNDFKLYLFYGNNEGHKNDEIKKIIEKNFNKTILKYDEKQIIDNKENFINSISNDSLFEKNKIIIIDRTTDKIVEILKIILNKNFDNLMIILKSVALDKKSKLRSMFERDKNLIIIPFYPDTSIILSSITRDFLKKKNLNISQSDINLIVDRCNGDRIFLNNELNKLETYLTFNKKIESKNLLKLINLSENYSIFDLIDSLLIGNTKRIIHILNENNFNNEDCIIIIKTYLLKVKKILKLADNFAKNKNLEMTILEAKPPIFWKEKDTVKRQLQKWKPDMLKKLISNINEVELNLKKNSQSSLNILKNFMFEQIFYKT